MYLKNLKKINPANNVRTFILHNNNNNDANLLKNW